MNYRNRIDDLLVQRATEGLDADERAELERLLSQSPEIDELCFDRAAALVSLAVFDPGEQMPSALMESLMRSADSLLGGAETD